MVNGLIVGRLRDFKKYNIIAFEVAINGQLSTHPHTLTKEAMVIGNWSHSREVAVA